MTLSTQTTAENDLLSAALGYADRGWHIFPLRSGSKKPATPNHLAHLCDRTDPKCRQGHTGWEQRATTNRDRIERAWSRDRYGIGIATGPSRLLVIDLDVPEAGTTTGVETLVDLERGAGQRVPATYTVRTPSGGMHLYFAVRAGSALTNSNRRLGLHIDTRGVGGYVVAPPTRLASGQTYRVLDDRPPARLPQWVVSKLQPQRRHEHRSLSPAGAQRSIDTDSFLVYRYVEAAVDGEIRRIATAQPGQRNNSLFIAAIALGQLVAGELLPLHEAQHILDTAAASHVQAGAYSRNQAQLTIASGLHRGQQEPRQPPGHDTTPLR